MPSEEQRQHAVQLRGSPGVEAVRNPWTELCRRSQDDGEESGQEGGEEGDEALIATQDRQPF